MFRTQNQMTSPNFLTELQEYVELIEKYASPIQLQDYIERYIGPSGGEIILNAIIGGIAGYIGMKLLRSSAAIIGIVLIVVEVICENGLIGIDRVNAVEKCGVTVLEWFLDAFYRRCVQHGFLGGMLIGIRLG